MTAAEKREQWLDRLCDYSDFIAPCDGCERGHGRHFVPTWALPKEIRDPDHPDCAYCMKCYRIRVTHAKLEPS